VMRQACCWWGTHSRISSRLDASRSPPPLLE